MAEEGQNNQGAGEQDEDRKSQDHINLRVVSQVCTDNLFHLLIIQETMYLHNAGRC